METKKESPEKSSLPTAATRPSAMNGNFGTSPLEKGWPFDDSAPYPALSRGANSKGYCPFGTAVANSISWISSGRLGRILSAFVVIF
jgi:hypothetical protein